MRMCYHVRIVVVRIIILSAQIFSGNIFSGCFLGQVYHKTWKEKHKRGI